MHTRFRGKMKGRSPLRRPRRRWVNNIKMDLPEEEWEGVGVIWLRLKVSGGLLRAH